MQKSLFIFAAPVAPLIVDMWEAAMCVWAGVWDSVWVSVELAVWKILGCVKVRSDPAGRPPGFP